jgi:hypothetical protein
MWSIYEDVRGIDKALPRSLEWPLSGGDAYSYDVIGFGIEESDYFF